MDNSLTHRVTIQSLTEGQDEIGQPITTWADVATVWADVRHPSGLSTIKADADVSIVKASVRIRHRADITSGMRLTHGGQAYDILAILPDGRRMFLDLVCQAIA